jgi:hypothetical protein
MRGFFISVIALKGIGEYKLPLQLRIGVESLDFKRCRLLIKPNSS